MTEFAGSQYVIEVIYLVASALFILSLKWMSSPATARHGILAGEIGMVLAIGGTLLHHGIIDYKWIIIALVLGSGIGVPLGMVQMTAVPQRTALSQIAADALDVEFEPTLLLLISAGVTAVELEPKTVPVSASVQPTVQYGVVADRPPGCVTTT